MPFTNPIIAGGETLIRSGIKSPNYVATVAGWRIAEDGSVDFTNATIRGAMQSANYVGISPFPGWRLEDTGQAIFQDVDINRDLYSLGNANFGGTIVMGPDARPVATVKPRVWGESDTNSLPPNNGFAFGYYLTLPIPPALQNYSFARFRFRCSGNFSKNVGVGGASYLQYYWAANADPTINSTMFAASERDSTYPAGVLPYSLDTYFDVNLSAVIANSITVGVLISNVSCAGQFVQIAGKAAFTAELILEEYSAAAIPNTLRKVQ